MKRKQARPPRSNTLMMDAADGSGSFSGYLALPPGGRGPGLVVAQEIFGVNQPMREIADAFAARGYVVLVPDLFWRLAPNVELGYTPEDWQKAFGYFQRFNVDTGVDDIQTAITTLREQAFVRAHVGVMGFCLGGKLAYLSACRTDADVAIGYYGVGIEDALDEAHHLHCPLVLHIAQLDKYCDQAAQEKISQSLGHRDDVQVWIYPAADHAFARPGGEHYHPPSADLALERSLSALQSALKF
jgi:carboxymethylenebutenolidase